MLFNFFGKKEDNASESIFSDRTYMTSTAKLNACIALAKQQPDTLFICWFAETLKIFKAAFLQEGIDPSKLMDARQVHSGMLTNKTPVFTEHYPLHTREMALVEHWPAKKIPVYSAMDEPLFKHLGSEKMLPVMKLLGMKENEVIEHALVSKSIIKGQDKIENLVNLEQPADSQDEWLRKNLK